MRTLFDHRTRKGFSLVELSVVIIVIGVLAAFAVPRFLDAVERSKAEEAFNYHAAVRAAQERYQLRQGTFAADIAALDVQMPLPKYFAVGNPAPGATGTLDDSWTLTLTRTGAPGGYGAYKVVFNDQGFDAENSDIPSKVNPVQR